MRTIGISEIVTPDLVYKAPLDDFELFIHNSEERVVMLDICNIQWATRQ